MCTASKLPNPGAIFVALHNGRTGRFGASRRRQDCTLAVLSIAQQSVCLMSPARGRALTVAPIIAVPLIAVATAYRQQPIARIICTMGCSRG